MSLIVSHFNYSRIYYHFSSIALSLSFYLSNLSMFLPVRFARRIHIFLYIVTPIVNTRIVKKKNCDKRMKSVVRYVHVVIEDCIIVVVYYIK